MTAALASVLVVTTMCWTPAPSGLAAGRALSSAIWARSRSFSPATSPCTAARAGGVDELTQPLVLLDESRVARACMSLVELGLQPLPLDMERSNLVGSSAQALDLGA